MGAPRQGPSQEGKKEVLASYCSERSPGGFCFLVEVPSQVELMGSSRSFSPVNGGWCLQASATSVGVN